MKKVLISGGSGTIGTELTKQLIERGIEVRWLSRSASTSYPGVKVFEWDPMRHDIDTEALKDVDTVFHLAGANVAMRWNAENKKTIVNSRVESTLTFIRAWEEGAHKPNTFISSSAVGYYPSNFTKTMHEDDQPGNGFLNDVVVQWENAVKQVEKYGIRTVRLRIGVVLSEDGGALGKMLPIYKMGLGSPLGSGKQWMPWIHLEDVARIFLHAATHDNMSGAYNTAAPNPVQNAEFSKALANALGKPHFMPAVPTFALKLAMGSMAQIALDSNRVSTDKLAQTGFEWKWNELEPALKDTL